MTPEELRQLAAAAEDLAWQITVARVSLNADVDEYRRRAGFRLEEAAGVGRRVAAELRRTADDLARLDAIPADACRLPFLVCPEHGNTLRSTGGESRCSRCGRRWPYSFDEPCPEVVTHTATDIEGTSFGVCDGHAVDVRARMVGATVRRQGASPG